MPRKSKAPGSAATVHQMPPEVQARYEDHKRYGFGSVVGWSDSRDPWGVTDWKAEDIWYQGRAHPNAWPPERGRS